MNFFDMFRGDDPRFKKNLWFFLGAYFLVLFNYPLIRAATTTLFFENHGAKSTPLAWLGSVLFLTLSIFVCNKIQKRQTVQKVFLWASLFSTLLFFITTLGHSSEGKVFSYFAFIWKEIYIVIQVHLLLAYANNYFRKDEFKRMIGPVGAVGSLGGVLGGLLTSYVSSNYGTLSVMWVALFFVLAPAILFLTTPNLLTPVEDERKKSPLESLKGRDIKNYVFMIAAIVMLTQFIINIADFKFNLIFEANILNSADRTGYLGQVYTWTNLLTFILQFLLLPFLLPRVTQRNFHLFIPVSYLVLVLAMMWGQGLGLMGISLLFIYLKASDYALFSGVKEILYQPLEAEQKYGAKYLTDMLVYRVSKAMIAAVLIYLHSSLILNVMMVIFLAVWIVLVFKLFQFQQQLKS